MHYAALGKSGACIKYLIKKGLPVNITDSQGNTALHIAAIEQDAEIIKVLCQNNGKVTIQNDSGLTPIDIAESLRNSSLRLLLQRYK